MKLNSFHAVACCDYNVGVALGWDSIALTGVFARKYFNVATSGLKVDTFAPSSKEWSFECIDSKAASAAASAAAVTSTVCHLEELKIKRKSLNDGSTSWKVDVGQAFDLCWTHSLHMTGKHLAEELVSTIKVAKTAFPKVKGSTTGDEGATAANAASTAATAAASPLPPPPATIEISGPISVQLFVSTTRFVKICSKSVIISGHLPRVRLKAPEVVLFMDEHEVLNAQDLNVGIETNSVKQRDGIFVVENR